MFGVFTSGDVVAVGGDCGKFLGRHGGFRKWVRNATPLRSGARAVSSPRFEVPRATFPEFSWRRPEGAQSIRPAPVPSRSAR
ncbi:CRISPR-associated protein Cas5 [Achromobacter xylosoxidans]|nr:CRISPR-associated protein Cas5 [Achromobacter xylosoxidans]